MADEIQKKPDNIVPVTEVNQYGDRSLHADHIDNLNVEVNVFNNQGSASKDEDRKPYVLLRQQDMIAHQEPFPLEMKQ